MKSVPAALTRQKRLMDYLLLLICPAMAGMTAIVAVGFYSEDTAQMYAWHALLVELLLCYAPAITFINSQGGPKKFGITRISASEWFFSILLGAALCLLYAALEVPLYALLEEFGMTRLPSVPIPGGWRFFACIFLVGILPAIAEETLLHGALLFTWLPHGKTAALWHSAILFTLIQLNPSALPLLLLVGLLFAHVSERSGSCYPAIAMYATINILSIILSYSVSNNLILLPNDPVIYGIIGIVLGVVSYLGLRQSIIRRRAMVMEAAHRLYKAVRDALPKELTKNASIKIFEGPLSEEGVQEAGHYVNPGVEPQHADRLLRLPGKLLVTITYLFLLLFNGLYLTLLFLE